VQSNYSPDATQSASNSTAAQQWSALAYALLVGLLGLGVLGFRIVAGRGAMAWPAILLFAVLSFLVQRSSLHLGSPVVHSLAGVIDLAAVLALGSVAGATVAAVSGLTYLEINTLRHRNLTFRHLIEIPVFNAGLKVFMALLSGWIFQALDGSLPLISAETLSVPAAYLPGKMVVAVALVSLSWFVLDHLGWGILDYVEGGMQQLRAFLRDAIPQALFVELLPLPFSLVLALVYARLHWLAFGLLAIAIVAVALLAQRWADARNELTQRVTELTTIEQVGRAVAEAQLDVDELCKLMYERASQIADTTIFHLGLFDGDEYVLKLWVRDGQPEPQRSFHLEPGVGLVNWLRQSGQPILVRDFEQEVDSLPAQPVYVAENPPRSALFVPLVADETVIGTMSIQSFRRHAYGESDLRVLSAMANQAAVAIQKAQLYHQERRRARQLETIGQVGRQVAATLELDDLFEQTARLIRDNFGYYHVGMYTVDPEDQRVTFQTSASAGQQSVAFEVEWGEGLIGWVAAHAEAVMVNDVENDERYRCIEALDETRSELAVPLLLEEELVGVLDVQSDQVGAFGPDDLYILETLGDQIAIAIQEAHLYEAERQQAWLSTALLQVADSMSHLSDMDEVLATIVRLTPILAGVDRCAILLWDADLEIFSPAQAHGLREEVRETFEASSFLPEEVPALELIRAAKVPLLVRPGEGEALIPADLAAAFDIEEMVLLPLLTQGELLGAMMVDYAGRTHHFGERMIDMLTGIANQAAMVIQSARLVQAQQEEAYVSMALLQVAEAVNRAADLEEALSSIARITPLLVGVEACALFLWDESSQEFVPYQQYGLEHDLLPEFWNLRFSVEEPLVQDMLAGKPFVTLRGTGESPKKVAILGKDASIALPMLSKGEVLGLMSVDYSGPAQRITSRWMNILTGIAGQAAIAIENDRLLQEAAEQERLKQELDVARRIQVSFLPECCPTIAGWELAAVWRSAREVGGDFYDFIPLPPNPGSPGSTPGRTGIVIADVADKGVPAALFMALSRTLVRTMAIDGRAPASAVARANDLILADAHSGLFVTLFYAILSPDSGEVDYVNAGHMPALLVRAADGSAQELRTHGMALGVLPDIHFEDQTAHLARGDVLVFYTDGVIEASDEKQQMFGRDRLSEVVSAHRHRSATELANIIDGAIAAFVGDTPQFDDFTLVVARRKVS
jgi:serine phosphatase RsbU (regulator of sigma subunit)/putative methionine-R-sulfoxide reductase with GAF domain